MPTVHISVVFLDFIFFGRRLRKSLNSWNSIKLIGTFALIADSILQDVHKFYSLVVIHPVQSGEYFVLNLITTHAASHLDDPDYYFCHATLVHPFKENVNQELFRYGTLILDYPSTFTFSMCTLSKPRYKLSNLDESKSISLVKLIHPDICGPVPNESYSSSKYFLTIIGNFCRFS
jgi:hypothetical protein